MTIYVDALFQWGVPGKYKGTRAAQAERVGRKHGHMWCHMVSDQGADCEELHAFARRLGMKREWFHRNHYDLTPTTRALALDSGAIEIDRKGIVGIWRKQRGGARRVLEQVASTAEETTTEPETKPQEACNVSKGPGGETIITCTRGSHVHRCACGRPARYQCDYQLTGSKAGKTCDRWLCDRCRVSMGGDKDLCLAHARMEGKTL